MDSPSRPDVVKAQVALGADVSGMIAAAVDRRALHNAASGAIAKMVKWLIALGTPPVSDRGAGGFA